MPELPDVDGFRRVIADRAVGQEIEHVEVLDPGVLHGVSAGQLGERLTGHRFTAPERRGKWLLAHTDGPSLVFHFGMTGSLSWSSDDAERQRFDRVVVSTEAGKLVYRDLRKLRGLWLAEDEEQERQVIGPQGPDALGLTGPALAERLQGRRGLLKTVLMDQKVLAGVGNMIADEVLWRAQIHPARSYSELSPEQRGRLDRCLQEVLQASIKVGHIPRGQEWLSAERGVPDPRCPRCGAPLRTTRIGGRTSYWCPKDQRAPKKGV